MMITQRRFVLPFGLLVLAGSQSVITPEVSSGELVEMLGFRYRIREKVFLFWA
jgi:hypothetical protein